MSRVLVLIAALLAISPADLALSIKAAWSQDNRSVPSVSPGNPFGGPIRPRRRERPVCVISADVRCTLQHEERPGAKCWCHMNGRWRSGRVE
jgi:hypothetical protein